MRPTFFVSDVHLSASRPDQVSAFLGFLAGPAVSAGHLYLLGDCFDRYLGDDDATAPHREVESALRTLSGKGVPISIAHGNHDFLIGADFCARTGCTLLPDHALVAVGGEQVLLMHGDTLCTDDHAYQAFRQYARDPRNQAEFLARPLEERMAEAERIRTASRQATRLKPDDIMDVNETQVRSVMREAGVLTLIHGHTHRPALHEFDLQGRPARRLVLGDWYDRDSVGVWDAAGLRLGSVADLEA